MCGRYTLTASSAALSEAYEVPEALEAEPRFNIAPTQESLVVRVDGAGERRLGNARWGLIPSWAKDRSIGNRLINARSETAATKPAFRAAFGRRRCLVAADGFYEWRRADDGTKQPYWIHSADGRPFAIAGLWERWSDEEETIDSFTLLTTGPNELMRPIHDRMPVILARQDYGTWLDRETQDRDQLQDLLRPCPDDWLEAYPVSTFVNSPKNDSPRCIARVD